jgi:hypothetical protein
MKIDTNRVAAYLAGDFPPYYESFPKVEFILLLSSKAPKIFTTEKLDLIEKHTSELRQFFSESLNLLKAHEDILTEIVEELKVPLEARGTDFVRPVSKAGAISKGYEKTIGFITPFDEEKEGTEEIINEVLKKYPGWKLETCSLEHDGDGKILWHSIKDFAAKYGVYIVDLRDRNINVAIEFGYILALEKPCIVITKEDLPSDIKGFIYAKKKEVKVAPGMTTNKKKEIEDAENGLKSDLEKGFKRYLT